MEYSKKSLQDSLKLTMYEKKIGVFLFRIAK